MTTMPVRVLGPIEVTSGDGSVPLGGARQRTVLALLLIARGEPVSVDHILETLWRDSPPRTARTSVYRFVSDIRRALGDEASQALQRTETGYRLEVPTEEFDAASFEQQVLLGREALEAGDAAGAITRFDAGLRMWRGAPFGDLAEEDFVLAERARLEEFRLLALERRADSMLALGRHAEVVGELETLTREHPLREGLWGQLMLALYRSDRQAEALRIYRRARRTLNEELGIEPSVQLQELEQSILEQRPELAPPPQTVVSPAAPDMERAVRGYELRSHVVT